MSEMPAATPPPITNPATAAPISACLRFLMSWPRQFVNSAIFERRSFTEKASSWRVSSIEVRIISGLRAPLDLVTLDLLRLELGAGGLGLLDRQLRHGRRSLLEQAQRQQGREDRKQEQHAGHDREAGPVVVLPVEDVVEKPGKPVEERRDAEDHEHPCGDPHHCSLGELRDLVLDLCLGELDLLTDKLRSLLGDLGDDLAERLAGVVVRRQPAGRHRANLFRIMASASPPANAAPTKASGRSAKRSLSLSTLSGDSPYGRPPVAPWLTSSVAWVGSSSAISR